jgi:hypothetical protein
MLKLIKDSVGMLSLIRGGFPPEPASHSVLPAGAGAGAEFSVDFESFPPNPGSAGRSGRNDRGSGSPDGNKSDKLKLKTFFDGSIS